MNDNNPTNQSFLQEQKQAAESFNIDTSDHEITSILRKTINESETFYDSNPAYKIKETRKKNAQILFGDHYKAGSYPDIRTSSIKYQESQAYAAIQTIISYLTARIPEVEARPWNNSVSGRLIARDFAKYAEAHGVEHNLKGITERILYDLMQKRVGVMKLVNDVSYKGRGEICPRHVDPSRIIIDHKSDLDGNPRFIAEKIPGTLGDIIDTFPDKKAEVFEAYNISKGTTKQLATPVERFEVWITGRSKDGKPEEQLVIFMGGIVLLKARNPHWLYDVETEIISNHLPLPPKPYILINLLNDGSNKLDQTSLIELIAPQQHSLNRLKRHILESTERYGGLNVFNSDAVSKEDVEELNFDGDESILVNSEDVTKAVAKVSPNFLPQWILKVAEDLVTTIHSIIGTPPNMRGDTSDTKTLGEAIMQRDQAEGRLQPLVRAMDNFYNKYYAMLFHMMKVHYTEEHWQVIAGEDGTFNYVMMQRDRLADGMDVYVKSGSSLPLDDDRLANIGVKLAEMDRISTLDLYKLLKLPKADEMAQNFIKDKIDPTLLAKNIKEDEGDRTAYQDYEVIMAGKYAPPREDPEAGHIDTHREQMMRDEYVTGTDRDGKVVWDDTKRQAFVEHVKAEVESLRRRAIALEGNIANQTEAAASPMTPGNEGMLPQPGQAPVEPGMTPAPVPQQPAMPALPEAPPTGVIQ